MSIKRIRRAFTLIETVIAIFVFSVGALGLAATSAAVMKSLSVSGARERAARIASSRLEIVRSLGCGQPQSGSETREGIQSNWTVSPSGTLASAVVTVTYARGGGSHTDSYTSLFPCRQ